jgi:hypothetical protein
VYLTVLLPSFGEAKHAPIGDLKFAFGDLEESLSAFRVSIQSEGDTKGADSRSDVEDTEQSFLKNVPVQSYHGRYCVKNGTSKTPFPLFLLLAGGAMDTSNLNVLIDIYGYVDWSGDNIEYSLSNSLSVTCPANGPQQLDGNR